MRLLLLILTTLHFTQLSGSITFKNLDIDKAVKQAVQENKLVFIDTYAVWCKPCKQMDQVFKDQNLGEFFNGHFISIKVDMDSRYGKEISKKYDVVWLPTLIILDNSGTVKNKIDKIVDAQELLQFAKDAVRPGQMYVDKGYANNPFGKSSTKPTAEKKLITEDNAPILYVHDERASSGRPHIMYHEAYLHMMLMDGKQHEVAKKYLSTQSDWSTDKNIKFIFDFLHKTNGPEFEYFLNNKSRFIDIMGEEQVHKTLSILSYERLYNGFPRPNLAEAITLFGHTDPTKANLRAYQYFLKRLYQEKQYDQYSSIAKEYLTDINPFDHKVMYQYSYSLLSHNRSAANLSECLKWAEEAIIYNDQNAQYHLHLANLHYVMSNRVTAEKHCDIAMNLAQVQGINSSEIIKLKNKLKEL